MKPTRSGIARRLLIVLVLLSQAFAGSPLDEPNHAGPVAAQAPELLTSLKA